MHCDENRKTMYVTTKQGHRKLRIP